MTKPTHEWIKPIHDMTKPTHEWIKPTPDMTKTTQKNKANS